MLRNSQEVLRAKQRVWQREYIARKTAKETTWTPVSTGPRVKPNLSTIAMVRKEKEIVPKHEKKLSTDEITEGMHQMLDLAFEKLGTPIERNEQGNIVCIRTNQ